MTKNRKECAAEETASIGIKLSDMIAYGMKLQGLAVILFLSICSAIGQDKPGSTFSGASVRDVGVCAGNSASFMTEKQVDDLVSEMLDRIGTKNRYIIVSCRDVDNCQATLFKGKPYILYNPEFLGAVRKLNFSTADIPATEKDWETLTILAHELGHHVNLAFAYRNGLGVAKDPEQAVRLSRLSAEQGNIFAQADLGYMYETGEGVAKDVSAAVKWYRMSSDGGNTWAKEQLTRMGHK
jgi:hypothetical protein